jgi:hypothetical protein
VKTFFFLLLIVGLAPLAQADEWTHQLGNSGYAIREAMHEGAAKKSPNAYFRAVKLQTQAYRAFHARDLEGSRELSKQAYDLAKRAYEDSKS